MQVKVFVAHKAVVNDICFDEEADYVASCSDDGSVSVCHTAHAHLRGWPTVRCKAHVVLVLCPLERAVSSLIACLCDCADKRVVY